MLLDALAVVILTGLSNAGILFSFKKWGILDSYNVYRKKWMPEATCYFCLSFWMAVASFLIMGSFKYLIWAPPTATVTAFLLTILITNANPDNQ